MTGMSQMERDLTEGRAVVSPSSGKVVPIRTTSWKAVDLGPVLRGEKRALEPSFLQRSDGQSLLYPSAPHVFYGESESLKSWAAFLACKSVLDDGRTALYIDFESNDVSFVERARKVGLPDESIGTALQYIRPEQPLVYTDHRDGTTNENEEAGADLSFVQEALVPSLIVVDGVSECYALHGWDINKATDAALFQKVFARWDGVASIAIDHSGKDAERGQIGSQHKRAGLDGAQFEFKALRREGRGGHSMASIKVRKDRHGSVRAFAPDERIGTIHVADKVWIEAPGDEVDNSESNERDRVVTFVTVYPGESSTAVIKGAQLRKSDGLDLLKSMESSGLIRFEEDGRATRWFPVDDNGERSGA